MRGKTGKNGVTCLEVAIGEEDELSCSDLDWGDGVDADWWGGTAVATRSRGNGGDFDAEDESGRVVIERHQRYNHP